jgi:hypothetical protein
MPTDNETRALEHLNAICPDTFDEGELGPWKFTDLSRTGATWTLSFQNAVGEDSLRFDFDGECVEGDGIVAPPWFEQVNTAILDWESARDGDFE